MSTNPDLLHDDELIFTDAPLILRLINLIIDVSFMLTLSFAAAFAAGAMHSLFDVNIPDIHIRSQLILIIFLLLSYSVLMTLFETLGRGRSIGKLLTRTTTVRKDGKSFTFRDAFIRSLIRIIPIEPFSILTGSFWHDEWSATRVIKKR